MAKAQEHLQRTFGADSKRTRLDIQTPTAVLSQLTKYQGQLVEGDRGAALEVVAKSICQAVKDVAAGNVNADAKDEDGVHKEPNLKMRWKGWAAWARHVWRNAFSSHESKVQCSVPI